MLAFGSRTVWVLAAVFCLVLSLPSYAQDDKKQDEDKVYTNKDAEKAEGVGKTDTVYTNDDLERLFGAAESTESTDEGAAGEAAPAEGEDPLLQLEQGEAKRKEREQAIKDAEKKVTELRDRISKLESEALTTRNPLLTRRVAPKEPEEGSEMAEGWDQLDQKERVERVDKELEKTRGELKQAEEALAKLRSGSGS